MKALFIRLFFRKKNRPLSASEFFRSASPQEKERLLREVARKSNADQRELVRRYHEKFPEKTS